MHNDEEGKNNNTRMFEKSHKKTKIDTYMA